MMRIPGINSLYWAGLKVALSQAISIFFGKKEVVLVGVSRCNLTGTSYSILEQVPAVQIIRHTQLPPMTFVMTITNGILSRGALIGPITLWNFWLMEKARAKLRQ